MARLRRRVLEALLMGAVLHVPVAADQVREVEVIVRGAEVHAVCTPGPIRAVLLHGDSADAASWRSVLERLDGRVGACAYDRVPRGGTDEAVPDRGWFELLDEMRTVHLALGAQPGYVLVGHGVAGLYARLFAVHRPGDLGGLILVDPAHEDFPREARPGMPAGVWNEWATERRSPNSDGIREAELARRARGTRLPDIPVTVLTATVRETGEGWNTRFVAEAARRTHASILRGVRVGRHLPATGSGPDIPSEAPDLVADEITRMVRTTTGNER